MAKTIIIVARTEVDGFGNLQVTDKEGNVIKIAQKREKLFPLFEQGKAVELDWQTYMNKDYVADARPVAGNLPESTEPPTDSTPPKAHTPPPRTEQTEAKVDATRKSIERQTSLKCATEWSIAQLQAGNPLKTTGILIIAKLFESYLDSGTIVEPKGDKDDS